MTMTTTLLPLATEYIHWWFNSETLVIQLETADGKRDQKSFATLAEGFAFIRTLRRRT